MTDQLINEIVNLVDSNDENKLRNKFDELHHADVAEILEELHFDQATPVSYTHLTLPTKRIV